MLRRERGQVTAEYVGVVLLVAVIVSTLVVSGPARPIADAAARAVCQITAQCSGGGAVTSVDPQAVQRAASDLRGLIARNPDPAAVAAFFKGLDGVSADDPRLRKLRELDDPNRRFLLFDPAGDGRAAEVFGDLTTARHVAVVVPGMDNDLNNFTGGDAERVQHQASQFDPDQVATIQWLGYDTPEGATALGTGAAEPGAEALPQFVEGIRAQRSERLHWTVIGHSYGSLVTGMAESGQGLEVDETVLVGSPGVGVDHACDLGEGNVWVGLAKWDLVGYSEWHGPNPHDRAFGGTRFHTGDISGHSSYFNEGSESLRNLGLITAGYLDEVNVNDGLF
jgi:Alpha/beta hydrolase